MSDVSPTTQVVKYKTLPDTLTTQVELYNLIFAVARKYDQPTYAGRLAAKGMTHLDLASEIYLSYANGRGAAKFRRKGAMFPAVDLDLPISKVTAYSIIARDMLNFICKRTPEEKANVQLVSENDAE